MGLHSIVRPKKPGVKSGKPHKVFENKLDQDFHADKPNQKWCTDFTYLFLKNGDVRYNCAIILSHNFRIFNKFRTKYYSFLILLYFSSDTALLLSVLFFT